MHLSGLYNFLKGSVGILALSIALLSTACEPNHGRNDTESNQDFAGEDNLPTADPNDSTSVPGEVPRDSTPASHPDLDDNPIIDKGVSTDSALDNNDNKRRKQ